MLANPTLTFALTVVLCIAFGAAAAASKRHRASEARPTIYNVAPHGVSFTTQCLPTDSPCRTRPDDW
jgi:hypothetical protein